THHIRQKYNLMIGERTAEEIKINIGSALESSEQDTMEIRGRNLLTGLPETVTISQDEVTNALKDNIDKIVHAVKSTLEKTPPELSADVMNRGIVLSGGGAMLHQIDKALSDATDIPVFITENPLESVAVGTGKSLEYIQHFKDQPNVASRTTIE